MTCTNNAKGIWNEETETVELETPVRQTVCIVEFGDGYVLSMLTEHGEVVSLVSKVVGRIVTTTFDIEEKAGYSLSDAKVICDNGTEGRISNKVITISNIKQNNTCKIITNPIEIIVTYDVNGGNAVSPNTKTVIYTGTYGSLPTPSRTGYTFVGWYTAISGGSKIEEDTEVTSKASHKIYAHWVINKYNVTLKVTNGTPTIETKQVEYNKTTTFTINANNGYILNKAEVSCDGGTYNQAGTLTVSNVTTTLTCTIKLAPTRITFTIGEDICAKGSTKCSSDQINNNSGPCYILYHAERIKDWNNTISLNGEVYENCIINNTTLYWYDSIRNKTVTTNIQELNWESNSGYWRYCNRDTWAECWVNLTCDN